MAKGTYHYVVGKDGRRRRVYDTGYRRRGGVGAVWGRRGRVFKGRGGYWSKIQSFGKKYVPKGTFKKVGAAAGAAIGSYFGAPIAGAGIGSKAGSILSKIAGFGAYKINKNTIMDNSMSPPAMHSLNTDVVIRHREYVCDIISSITPNTFNNQGFAINPGLQTTFPWLYSIAQNFQEYQIRGMVLEYKPVVGTAIASSTNPTMGGVVMATNYNSLDQNFQTKRDMENVDYTTACMIYENAIHPIECDMRQNPISTLYIRSGAVPSGADIRMYDLGNFQIATWGIQGAAVTCGELWLSYDIVLRKPIAYTLSGQGVLTDMFYQNGTGSCSGVSPLNYFSADAANSIGGSLYNGDTYRFPSNITEGYYLVYYQANGTSASTAYPSSNLEFYNCDPIAVFNTDDSDYIINVSATCVTITLVVKVNAANSDPAYIQFAYTQNAVWPSPVAGANLLVTQWNSNNISPY
jgi:hypothetical protein